MQRKGFIAADIWVDMKRLSHEKVMLEWVQRLEGVVEYSS